MQSVSAIVARPGTGTTSEAILLGCPLIHNGVGGIMPQEWITVKFCQKNKLSRVTGSPRHLAEIIREWLQNPEELHAIRQHMQKVLPSNNPPEMMYLILSFPSTQQP
jgi:processive 1,2-diacylglycerol beta-glucosyltransferase